MRRALLFLALLSGCATVRQPATDVAEYRPLLASARNYIPPEAFQAAFPPLQLHIFGQSEPPSGFLGSLNMNGNPIIMDRFASLDADGNGIISILNGSIASAGDYIQTANTAELLNNGGSLGVYLSDADGTCIGNGSGNQSIPLECDGTVYAGTFSTVAGAGGATAFAGGTLSATSTAVGNVGAGTDDLITYAMPANTLTASGRGLRIRAWGTTANNANAKTVTLNWGSQVIMTQALTTSLAGTWRIDATVLRTGSSTQDVFAELLQLSTVLDKHTLTAGTQTETGAITIKCTGTATTDNDIVNEGLLVEFL